MERKKLSAHSDLILAIKFTLSVNYLVTASADTTLKSFIVKIETMDLVPDKTFYGHSMWVWDIETLPDSKYLLSVSSDGYLKCWRLSDGFLVKDNAFIKNDDKVNRSLQQNSKFVALALKTFH